MPEKKMITRRETVVTLLQGADYDEERRLLAAVEEAAQFTPAQARLGDNESVKAAASAYDEFMAKAEKRGVPVKLVALRRKDYRAVVMKHPPRDGNDVDRAHGFNFDTCGDDLVSESVAEGEFSTTTYRDEWLDELPDGQFSKLYGAAISLNRLEGPDPKDRLSSRIAQTSSASSKSPGRLG